MKTLPSSLFALTLTMFACGTSFGQYGFENYGGYGGQDPMAAMNQLMVDVNQVDPMAEMNRLMQEANAAVAQSERAIVDGYRRETGDMTTPDHVIVNHVMSQYYAQNPAAFQRKMQEENQAFQATQNAWNDANNTIRNSQNEIYRNRSESMDRINENFNRGVIREESVFQNSTTGGNYVLPTYNPNVYHTDNNGSTFLQDASGQYRQYDSSGFHTEMEDTDW